MPAVLGGVERLRGGPDEAERAVAAAGHGPDLGAGEGVALLDGAVRQSGEGLAHRRVHEARIRGGADPVCRALFAVVDHAGRAP